MRKEKQLINFFRRLVELISEEAARNPEFSIKVESLLSELPSEKRTLVKPSKLEKLPAPDIYAEYSNRGEAEFRLWLRSQPIQTLRAIISREDMDPARRAAKWKDVEKLAEFIAASHATRLSRGSAFMNRESIS
jgi:hypothetical protein